MKSEIERLYPTLNKRSIINLLRHKYVSMECAYLDLLKINSAKCKYCGENSAVFISIFKGYGSHCKSSKCVSLLQIDAHKKTTQSNIITDYVEKNCFVCNKRIFVRNVKRKTNGFFICSDDFCVLHKNHPFLREDYLIDNFCIDVSYLNKLAYSLMKVFNDPNKVRRILYKNLLIIKEDNFKKIIHDFRISPILQKKFNEDDFILTRDNLFYLNIKSKEKHNHIQKIYGESYQDFIKQYYPECISDCEICKKTYIHSTVFGARLLSNKTCSLKCYYKNFKAYSTEEKSIKRSISMKTAIKEGRFTPCVHNSLTHNRIELVDDKQVLKFRSTWELLFYAMYNGEILYEDLRISYKINDKERIYIVDFIDKIKKITYEIKPLCHKESEINIAKESKLLEWCKANNYSYVSVDETYIQSINYQEFIKTIDRKNYKINNIILDKIKKLTWN